MFNKDITQDTIEEIIETPIPEIPNTPKIEKCKVYYLENNNKTIALEFKGFGITVESKIELDKDTKFVDISYTSDIGFPDFTYELVD